MKKPSKVLFASVFLIAAVCLWQCHSVPKDLTSVLIREHAFFIEENIPAVNLNTATIRELSDIPGVTRSAARTIVDYREKNGGFSDISELLSVLGISRSMAVYLLEHVYVSSAEDFTEIPETLSPTDPDPLSPTESESKPESATKPKEDPVPEISFPLSLNDANEEELRALPEIGTVLAAAIIEYRNRIGAFTSVEQLLDVPGIGEGKLSAIRPFIYLPAAPETAPPETEIPPETELVIPQIELNTTTKEELMLLPGCTAELADSILYLRSQIHVFQNPLELLYIDDVTDALLLQWMPYLTADPPATE